MADSGKNPISIEPLTPQELKERGQIPRTAEDDPNYEKDWLDKDIPKLVAEGFKYYKRTMRDGKVYMNLRKKRKERGIGLWTDEREGKLFHFYPQLGAAVGITPAIWAPPENRTVGNPQGRGFATVPISRVAIIPRDYVPVMNVIRYFEILKENGFPGDFSRFINDIVTYHFEHCRGIRLPVLLESEMKEIAKNVEEEQEEIVEQTAPAKRGVLRGSGKGKK